MTDNQFDNIFSKRLENFSSNVPGDMWDRINKKDKDRKGFFIPRWYWFVLLLLLFGVGNYYVLNNKTKSNLTSDEIVNEGKNKISKSADEIVIDEYKNEDSIHINKTGEEFNKSVIAKNKILLNKNDAKRNKQTLSDNSNVAVLLNQQPVSDEIKINDGGDVLDKESVTESSSNKTPQIKNKQKDSSAIAGEKSDDEKDETSYKDKFSLELFASPVLPISAVKSNDATYEHQLKDAGKMQLSYTIGARLSVKITDKLYGKIGVQYSRFNQTMSFSDSIQIQSVKTNNQYKSIDIPLLISCKINLPDSIKTYITAGALLNINSKYKGQIPDQFGDAININNTNVYKGTTGVSLYVSLDVSKQLNNKLDLFAEPYLQYRLKSITNNIQPFTQKNHAVGLSLGVRYRLFKNAND